MDFFQKMRIRFAARLFGRLAHTEILWMKMPHSWNLGLTDKSIKKIVSKCKQLTDFNVKNTYLSDDAIRSMCRHLPSSLQKLCIANLCIRDEHIRNLVQTCPNLIELDLCLTEITFMAVPYITEKLSNSLVKLSLPQQVDDLQELIQLGNNYRPQLTPLTQKRKIHYLTFLFLVQLSSYF